MAACDCIHTYDRLRRLNISLHIARGSSRVGGGGSRRLVGAGEHGCAAELWGVLLREVVEGGGQIVSFKHLLVVDVHQRWPALGCVVCFNLQILQTLNLLAYVLLVAAVLGGYFVVGDCCARGTLPVGLCRHRRRLRTAACISPGNRGRPLTIRGLPHF